MSNRVEELESKVAELEATVDGLTEELVETRERLRSLESEHEIESGRAPDRRVPEESDPAAAEPSDDVEADNSTEEKGKTDEGSESEDSDIIVA